MFMCRSYEAVDSSVRALSCAMFAYGDIAQAMQDDAELAQNLQAAHAMDRNFSSQMHVFGEILKYYVENKESRTQLIDTLKTENFSYTADVLSDMMKQADFRNRIAETDYQTAAAEYGDSLKIERGELFRRNKSEATEVAEDTRLLRHSDALHDALSGLGKDIAFAASAAIGAACILA